MPPLPAHPGVLKIRTHFTDGNDTAIVTTVYFTYTGTAPSDATCVTMAGTIESAAATEFLPMLNNDASLTGVEVTDLSSDTAGHGEATGVSAGTRGTAVLPAEVAVLQNFPIARRYRGGKPRVYWPFGIATDLLNPSSWTTTFRDAVEAATAAFFEAIVASGTGGCTVVELVSISNYHGFTPVTNPVTGRTRDVPTVRSVAIAPDVVLSIPVNLKPGSQRRRSLHGS